MIQIIKPTITVRIDNIPADVTHWRARFRMHRFPEIFLRFKDRRFEHRYLRALGLGVFEPGLVVAATMHQPKKGASDASGKTPA